MNIDDMVNKYTHLQTMQEIADKQQYDCSTYLPKHGFYSHIYLLAMRTSFAESKDKQVSVCHWLRQANYIL